MTQNKPDDTGALTDAATISEQIREHELLRQTFRDAISSVGEEHYEQWAGMGPEQVLVFGESLDVVINRLKPNGKDHRPTVVEYLTAEPPVLILSIGSMPSTRSPTRNRYNPNIGAISKPWPKTGLPGASSTSHRNKM